MIRYASLQLGLLLPNFSGNFFRKLEIAFCIDLCYFSRLVAANHLSGFKSEAATYFGG